MSLIRKTRSRRSKTYHKYVTFPTYFRKTYLDYLQLDKLNFESTWCPGQLP